MMNKCYFCDPNISNEGLCDNCLQFHKDYVWSGKLNWAVTACCVYPPSEGGFLCAGGDGWKIMNDVRKWLEERNLEYNGDNALCALYNLGRIK